MHNITISMDNISAKAGSVPQPVVARTVTCEYAPITTSKYNTSPLNNKEDIQPPKISLNLDSLAT